MIEIDHGAQDGSRSGREFFQLREYRIRLRALFEAALDRAETLLREPRDTAVFAFCRIGEFAQAVRGLHAGGCGFARVGMRRRERQLYQQRLVGYAQQRALTLCRVGQSVQRNTQR